MKKYSVRIIGIIAGVLLAYGYLHNAESAELPESTQTEQIEATQPETETEATEVTVITPEPPTSTIPDTETETETESETETETAPETAPEKEYRYIECKLDKELQEGIFDICERYSISYELVMAVIWKESLFNINAVGDNGKSIGLMQVQERCVKDIMEELGVTDLFDPLQNVEVGVVLLVRYFEKYGEVYDALMAYNGGCSYANRMIKAGKVSKYALAVVEKAAEYTEQNE